MEKYLNKYSYNGIYFSKNKMQSLQNINKITQQTYDKVAKVYHKLFKDELGGKQYDRDLLDKFSKYFNNNSKIYDLGCGPSGHIGYYLFEKGLNVTGVDISEKCIEIASRYHPEMNFLNMDMSNLEIEDSSIDGIISYHSIIHTPKKYISNLFKEFHRVLKPNGKILLTVKEGNEEGMQEELLGVNSKIYFTYFQQDEVVRYFKDNGFEIIFNESRAPLEDEIDINRIYVIGKKM